VSGRTANMVTALATLVVIEIALQLLAAASPKLDGYLTAHSKSIPVFIPDSLLEHRPNPAYPTHDAEGFRNEGVPAEVDIVCLGDSQTYGTGVKPDAAWPRVLGSSLDATVYSMAFGGYGPTHSLLLLDKAAAMKPKLIIEAIYSGNDFVDSFRHVYVGHRLSDLQTDDMAVREAVNALEDADPIMIAADRLFEMGAPVVGNAPAAEQGLPWRHRVKLYLFCRAAKDRVLSRLRRSSTHAHDSSWEGERRFAVAHPYYCEVFEDSVARTVFTPRYREVTLNAADPRVLEGFRMSMEAVRRMKEETDRRGIRFLVVLIPTKESVYAETVAGSGHVCSEAYAQLVRDESIMLEHCRRFLDEHDVDYIDVSVPLKESLSGGQNPYREHLDGHPNEVGHRVIAESIGRRLTR